MIDLCMPNQISQGLAVSGDPLKRGQANHRASDRIAAWCEIELRSDSERCNAQRMQQKIRQDTKGSRVGDAQVLEAVHAQRPDCRESTKRFDHSVSRAARRFRAQGQAFGAITRRASGSQERTKRSQQHQRAAMATQHRFGDYRRRQRGRFDKENPDRSTTDIGALCSLSPITQAP
jgi:hypothetical protein